MDEVSTRINKALQQMGELAPFLLFRFGVYAAVGAGLFVYWCLVCLVSAQLAGIAGILGWVIVIVAFALQFGFFHLWGFKLFVMVKAGYVAVLTEIATRGQLPAGSKQVEFGRGAVEKRFGDAAKLAAAQERVKKSIGVVGSSVREISEMTLLPGTGARFMERVTKVTVGMVEAAVLSRVFFRNQESVGKASRDGIVLYSMFGARMVRLAAAMVLVDWLSSVLTLLMMMVVVGMPVFVFFPASMQLLGIVAPFVAAYVMRLALIEPLAVTAVVLAFDELTRKKETDAQIAANMDELCEPFRKLKD